MNELRTILYKVSQSTGTASKDIQGKSRQRRFTVPRFLYCRLARLLTDATYGEIGREIGDRDHTTVMHSIKEIKDKISTNDSFTRMYIRRVLEVHPEWSPYLLKDLPKEYNGSTCSPVRIEIKKMFV